MRIDDSIHGKKVFVTGATGFLGRHLLPELLASGAIVTALTRSGRAILPDGVNTIQGDCEDASLIARAVKNQHIVIHMAGLLFGAKWQDYMTANSLYAENIANAVQDETSVERVVFISSLAAAGPSGAPPGRNEKEIPAPVSAYGWSKLMAERIFSASLGDRLVILRPPVIYGSGDKGLLPLFKSCSRGFGVSPGLRKFPLSVIHAKDVAKAIILVAGRPCSGIYHLSDGQIHNMDVICKFMGSATGRKKTMVMHFPLKLMGMAASLSSSAYAFSSWLCRIAGRSVPVPPVWNQDKFLEAQQAGWLSDGTRIVRELGFSPVYSLESGMAEAVAGYRKDGWL